MVMAVDPSARHGHARAFVFATILIDAIGFGIIIPVMPNLIRTLTGADLSTAARYGGLLMMVFSIAQFFFAPVLGNLSDRFGRRPVLLVSLLIFAVDYLISAFAPTIAWLFAARLLSGMAAATYSTANALIADTAKGADKAKGFGMIGAMFGIGFILGPVIGGFLGELGPRAPFFGAAALAFANFVMGLLFLPETLPKAERRPFEWRKANPVGALVALRAHRVILGLAAVLFLHQFAHLALASTWTYAAMEKFSWGPREVGLSLGVAGVMMAVVQGGLVGKAIKRFGAIRAASIGLLGGIAGYLGYAFAPNGAAVLGFIVIGSIAGLAYPAIMGIMSDHAPKNAQGELQGGVSSLVSATAVFSPLLMTQIFSYFTAARAPVYFPGAAFFTAALLDMAALAVFLWAVRNEH